MTERSDSNPAVLPDDALREPGRWAGWFRSGVAATAAAIAVALTALVLWGWRSAAQIPDGGLWAGWGVQALDLGLALIVGLVVATVVTAGFRLVGRRPSWWLLWSVVSAGFLVATMGAGASLVGWVLVVGALLTAAGVLAAAVAAGRTAPRSRIVAGAAGLVLVVTVGFLMWPGGSAPTVDRPAFTDGVVALPDTAVGPSPGDAGLIETRYGAGRPGPDREYGPGVAMLSTPVDASGIVGGWAADSTRSGVWGFDASSLPLNGILWRPADDDAFPLVVMVHGNTAFDHSERGLAYLGRSLAARGYVVASIDENFLNTGIFDRSDPLTGVDAARAWLVLQHVRQLLAWNDTPESPLEGRIDPSRISLVGHSRGGEAVAVAAAFNTLSALPDNPAIAMDFHFPLRTVVALAPSDGQYGPRGARVVLKGMDYLTVAGTMDADVGTFAGARQFARVDTDDNHLAAAVAIHRANHTQFNSDWGRTDVGLGAAAHLLATGALLTPDDQQRAAAGLVGAFLDLTVRDASQYRGLFDGTATIPSWLPDTVYLRRFITGDGAGLVRFDEGDSVDHPWGAAEITGGQGDVVGLPTRTGPSPDRVLSLTTGTGETGYRITGLAGRVGPNATLTVDAGTDASASDTGIAMRVATTDGTSVEVALRPWTTLPGQLDGRTLKPFIPGGTDGEVLLQTFSTPVSALTDQGIDSADIAAVTVVLTGGGGNRVYLDNVGMR